MYATQTVDEVLAHFSTMSKGLSDHEAQKRLLQYGANELPRKKQSLLLLFLRQFNSILVYILLVALVLSLVLPFFESAEMISFMDFFDAIAIAVILLLNALLGFFQEWKAENAIALLTRMSEPQVRVLREGAAQIIPSRLLVPGDILLLEEGDTVSADARIMLSRGGRVDEASLTGESKPVQKGVEPIRSASSIGDQTNMVFRGTVVTSGHLTACVTATGTATELGKIAEIVSTVEHPPTPLERTMASLGTWLGVVVLLFCGLIFVVGALRDLPLVVVLLSAASLAVSAVPEGLPAIVTVCLAIGVQRMIRRKVLTRELSAIETLGSITVICSDKTGTITENKMEVQELWVDRALINIQWSEQNEHVSFFTQGTSFDDIKTVSAHATLLLQIGASCNNAHSLTIGDPTEIGLLQIAERAGVQRLPIAEEDVPFSSEKKYMMTTHRGGEEKRIEKRGEEVQFLKGAPEVIVDLCDLAQDQRQEILAKNAAMAARALRVLAGALQSGASQKATFIGLIGMLDPPRDGVRDAITLARRAGIRTMMITGDHALTAKAIAERVGISGDVLEGKTLDQLSDAALRERVKTASIFARVSPLHKVKILAALQENGEIVAMGGDGVNDAPALKKADVGFAMGKQGTDVARETAQIVLTDDHFASVVSAIEEGRTIYDNINKFVVFLLRANFDELMVVFGAMVMGFPLPYLPIHILLVNLMTDSFPAMALAMEKPAKDIMLRPPRNPKEHILHGEISFILLAAIIATVAAFQIFFSSLREFQNVDLARTMVVANSILFELTLVFTCRSKLSLLTIGIFSNRYLVGAVTIAFAMLLLCMYSPINIFTKLLPLTPAQWVLPVVWSVGALAFFELLKVVIPGRRVTW